MYPVLSRFCKNKYLFKIAAPSYIYPDHIIPNVTLLAPHLDEIEILLFESKPESLPSESDIRTLADISQQYGLSYNIHLPTDVSLTHPDKDRRKKAVDILLKISELTAPLNPTTCTLHLPHDGNAADSVGEWQERAYRSMEELLSQKNFQHNLSVETLNYPFTMIDPVLRDFNISICMDIGHLICHGFDISDFFDYYRSRISIIHLSGVENGKDHLALNRMSEQHMASVCRILGEFGQIVSLEVFSYNDLNDSLAFLEKKLNVTDRRC